MKLDFRIPLFILAVTIPASVLTAEAVSNPPPGSLASVESFSSISDQEARSAAYFTELGKVLTYPRCLNCHPAGDRPRQGDMARLHQPPVERGRRRLRPSGAALSDLPSGSELREGARKPDLASRAARNGLGRQDAEPDLRPDQGPRAERHRSLETLVEHIGEDHLVGWAWAPGPGRQSAPGTQKEAGALVAAWVQTGAACPKP